MATRIVFPDFMLAHWLPDEPCERCGRANYCRFVRYPTISQEGDDVAIRYPANCAACGGLKGIQIHMPILQFGYLLARIAKLDAWTKSRRSKASMQVSPGKPEIIQHWLDEFPAVLAQQARALLPNDADQASFGLGTEDWKDFLRRMGMEPGDGA